MNDKLRILIVDDDQRMATTLQDILTVKGYTAESAHSGSEALFKLKEKAFDCVLSDIKMPEMSGVELHQAIKEIQPDLPVVFMTAYTADETVRKGLAEGAIASLPKPLDINMLLNFFSALQRESTIMIVDDDSSFCTTLRDILQARKFNVTVFMDPSEALQTTMQDGQVILLDMKLNGINGVDVLKEIRSRHPHLPVILVTGYRQEMSSAIEAGLKISAYTYLYKPLEIDKLMEVLAEIQKKELGRILGRPVKKRK